MIPTRDERCLYWCIMSSTASCIVLSSSPYHTCEASPEFAGFFGYCPDEIKGRSLQLLHGPDSVSTSINDMIKALGISKQQKSEIPLFKKDGTRLQVLVNVEYRPTTCSMDSAAAVSVHLSAAPCASGDIDHYRHSEGNLQDSVCESLNIENLSSKHLQQHEPMIASDAILGMLRIVLSRASCQVFSVPCVRGCTFAPNATLASNWLFSAIALRRLSARHPQICKTLLAQHKNGWAPPAHVPSAIEPTPGAPLELVAQCARQALAAIQAACGGGDGWDAERARVCATLLEAEALPQAARWHRRDLVPALLAVWRAVLRALARCAAPAPLPPPAAPH